MEYSSGILEYSSGIPVDYWNIPVEYNTPLPNFWIDFLSFQERGTSCTRFAPDVLAPSKPKIDSSGLLPDITKSRQLRSYSPRPPRRRLAAASKMSS